MLLDNDSYVSSTSSLNERLKLAAAYIRDFYQTDIGISLLHDGENVHLGVLTDKGFNSEEFVMTQKRNLIKHRTPNYVYIRLINLFS